MSYDINGWIDPLIGNKAFIDFATYAPQYGRFQEPNIINAMTKAYYIPGECRGLLQGCSTLGNTSVSNDVCYPAAVYCVSSASPPIRVILASLTNFFVSAVKF